MIEKTETIQGNKSIPWLNPDILAQVRGSIEQLESSNREQFESIRGHAQKIKRAYTQVSAVMDELCVQTCPQCTDICCVRASIWYDFSDLLYLYMGLEWFPQVQIRKVAAADQGTACCHLAPDGCRLSRVERPFVCTRYLCPAQIAVLAQTDCSQKETIDAALETIKVSRQEMDRLFMACAAV